MRYAENTPRALSQVEATNSPGLLKTGEPHNPENDLDRVSGVVPMDSKVFDRLHDTVYETVKPETYGERRFLTRCLQAVLSVQGQWTEAETMRVLKVLVESRAGVKVMFGQVEFTNDGLPDAQVA